MKDEEIVFFKKLTTAIDAQTEVLRQLLDERKRELVTKQDLKQSEARILEAIQVSEKEEKTLGDLLVRARKISNRAAKLAARLWRLDSQTAPE